MMRILRKLFDRRTRVMTTLRKLFDRLKPEYIAWIAGVIGVFVGGVGTVNQYCPCPGLSDWGPRWNGFIGDFYANIAVDGVSIAIAILVIDKLNKRRAEQELKAELIRRMGSPDNGIALQALEEVRAHGWLTDGSLRGENLAYANLEGAKLEHADLQGANLRYAKLKGAKLREIKLQHANLDEADLSGADLNKSQLQHAKLARAVLNNAEMAQANLQDAVFALYHDYVHIPGYLTTLAPAASLAESILPSGEIYDGRLNLLYDVSQAKFLWPDLDETTALAHHYRISEKEYLAGQAWAREHLNTVRQMAEIDPDTGKARRRHIALRLTSRLVPHRKT